MAIFRATHIATTAHGEVPVMLDADASGAGPAYTVTEWDTETSADFECDGERWTFQGDPLPLGSVRRLEPGAPLVTGNG